MKRSHKNHSGFTLIEVLVGTAVFAVGIAGSVGLMAWIARAGAYNSRIVSGVVAGQALLEEFKDAGYDALSSGRDTNGVFDLSWNVSSSNTGYRTIDLEVAWENHDGASRRLEFSTMLAEDSANPIIPDFLLPGNGGGAVTGGVPVVVN